MSLFKSKEEKVLDEIKKKKQQMDKLKEEIVKMGKLVLKDGKLTKVEDIQKDEVKTQVNNPVQQTQIDYTDSEINDMVQAERIRRQATLVNTPKQVPPPLTQEDYNRIQQKKQQDMMAYEQQYLQEQAAAERQRQIEAYEQQQFRQQPQAYQQPVQQQITVVNVSIEMVTGNVIVIQVPGDKIESFVEALNIAIDNQSSFPMNDKVINGRNVVSYTLE